MVLIGFCLGMVGLIATGFMVVSQNLNVTQFIVTGGNTVSIAHLSASLVDSGTLADAQLTANVDLLNANQTISGSKTFSGATANTLAQFGNGKVLGSIAQEANLAGFGETNVAHVLGTNGSDIKFSGTGLVFSNNNGTVTLDSGGIKTTNTATGASFNTPTNQPADGQVVIATGNGGDSKWGPAGSGVQTPWAQDENAAGFKLTNASQVVVGNDPKNGLNTITGNGQSVQSTNNGIAFVRDSASAGSNVTFLVVGQGLTSLGGPTNRSVTARMPYFAPTNGIALGGTVDPGPGNLNASNNVSAVNLVISTNGFASYTNNAAALNSITFPATTVNWTNTNPFNIVMYIDNTGVTGTVVKKNVTTIASSVLAGDIITLLMKPGDYFSETYSLGTPIGKWEPF